MHEYTYIYTYTAMHITTSSNSRVLRLKNVHCVGIVDDGIAIVVVVVVSVVDAITFAFFRHVFRLRFFLKNFFSFALFSF